MNRIDSPSLTSQRRMIHPLLGERTRGEGDLRLRQRRQNLPKGKLFVSPANLRLPELTL